MKSMREFDTDAYSRAGLLLDSFIEDRRYVPPDAQRIRSAEDLPMCFRIHVRNRCGHSDWRAWSRGGRVWFVVGQARPELHRDLREIVLEVHFYGPGGDLVAAATWLRRTTGHWVLYQILEIRELAGRVPRPSHVPAEQIV